MLILLIIDVDRMRTPCSREYYHLISLVRYIVLKLKFFKIFVHWFVAHARDIETAC